MIELRNLPVQLKFLLVAVVCGLLASLGTGIIINDSGMGIPEVRHYGYPLAWLVSDLNGPTEYILANLAIDAAFWVAVSLVALVFLKKMAFPCLGIRISSKLILFLVVLFIPLGLLMDLVHEFGHAAWGTAVGGRFVYMKIAYLEIYPALRMTPQFCLGCVSVDGLAYSSMAYGLMLLGGSVTTNVASWILGLILLKGGLGSKTQVALKVLGVFGILDLPFYVVFPQIGLGHWIFLGGGSGPEPLTGARMVGVPDPVFYLMVTLSTLGLVLLYSKTLREKLSNRIKALLSTESVKKNKSESVRNTPVMRALKIAEK
ncbi:MAG: hypothetical protein OEY22_10755 [Candidatus Bathyarchaeota archaeon]|nr:hypothetical protein [Candidatus Bathyarchaeota archaeon]MDH5787332.1 hypothetical protein [Candidatus Bathyarchaeota archaeon]